MLFDLRGRGRRRVVQVIYLFLAVLMGGGLVLFGIGGNTSGGLFDAFSSDNSNGSTTSSYTKQIDAAQKQIDTNPRNAAAWAKLASLRLADGGAKGGFEHKQDGLAAFGRASGAWEHYVALKPPRIDRAVATQMINLYGQQGLNQPDKAVGVMDLLIEQTTPPTADLYKQYAVLAYTAGQTRKGDLAADKAVALSPPTERKQVRAGLEAQKAQASAAKGTSTAAPPVSTATTPPPTATSNGGSTSTSSGKSKTTTGK